MPRPWRTTATRWQAFRFTSLTALPFWALLTREHLVDPADEPEKALDAIKAIEASLGPLKCLLD